MANDIFISYRRDDSSGYAHAIYGKLRDRFANSQLFMDVNTIDLGVDFHEVIDKALDSCEVLLALIGRNWMAPDGESGSRIEKPNDYVRLEISKALKRNIRVIPILLDGATIPNEKQLPPDLVQLARRNGIEISSNRFDSDVQRLLEALDKILLTEASLVEVKSNSQEQNEVSEAQGPLDSPEVATLLSPALAESREPPRSHVSLPETESAQFHRPQSSRRAPIWIGASFFSVLLLVLLIIMLDWIGVGPDTFLYLVSAIIWLVIVLPAVYLIRRFV